MLFACGLLPPVELPDDTEIPEIRARFAVVCDIAGSLISLSHEIEGNTEHWRRLWSTLPTVLTVPNPLGDQLNAVLNTPYLDNQVTAQTAERLAKQCFNLHDDGHLLPRRLEDIRDELSHHRAVFGHLMEQASSGIVEEVELLPQWLAESVRASETVDRLRVVTRDWEEARDSFCRVVRTLVEVPPPRSVVDFSGMVRNPEPGTDLASFLQADATLAMASILKNGIDPRIVPDERRQQLDSLAQMSSDELEQWVSSHPSAVYSYVDTPLDVADVSSWWQNLDDDTRQRLCEHAGMLTGNLGGVPFCDRDRALRHVVEDDAQWPSGPEYATERQRIRDQLALDHKMPFSITNLDLRNPDTATFALGHPDSAVNNVQIAGGMGTNISDADGDHIAALMNSSEALEASLSKNSGGQESAVYVTLYAAPHANAPIEEALNGRAVMAGKSIARQAETIRAMAAVRGTPVRMTAVGHSYGTTGLGEAVYDAHSGTYDSVVFLGSAGLTGHGEWAMKRPHAPEAFYADHPSDNIDNVGRGTGDHGFDPKHLNRITEIDPGKREHDDDIPFGSTFYPEEGHDLNESAGGPTEPGGFNSSGFGYLAPNGVPIGEIQRIAEGKEPEDEDG